MAGRRTVPVRLASNRQLWRLNGLGYLRLDAGPNEPITSEQARIVISGELDKLGLSRFPGADESREAPPDIAA